jgi:hypothetical protein
MRQKNIVTSAAWLGPKNDCAGEDQQQFQPADPFSRQRERPTPTKPQLSHSNKNLLERPLWVLENKTDWLTDGQSQCVQVDFDLSVEFRTGGCEERTCTHEDKSPLLEAVA